MKKEVGRGGKRTGEGGGGEEGEEEEEAGSGGSRGPRKDFCLSFPTHTLSIPKFADGFIWFLFEGRGETEQARG